MQPEIAPGSMVKVEVTRRPSRAAAAKTLSRLFAKDAAARKRDRLRTRIRQAETEGRRRGGRIWFVRPAAPRLVQPGRGDACRIRATVDVLRDLGSVARFVKVSVA